MSEIINNREQESINKFERQAILKKIIKNLHNGKSVEEVNTNLKKQSGILP